MGKEDLYFGSGFETEDSEGIFGQLSDLITKGAVQIGSDIGPEGPEGGVYARLLPPELPPYLGSVALIPPTEQPSQEQHPITGSLQ